MSKLTQSKKSILWVEWMKWYQTIITHWHKMVSYRWDFYLQIFLPPLAFFITKYFFWKSIYQYEARDIINGLDLAGMLSYHAWVFIVSFINQSQNSYNLSEEIRLGKITPYLIYPFNLWKFHFSAFLSGSLYQILVATFCLFALIFLGLDVQIVTLAKAYPVLKNWPMFIDLGLTILGGLWIILIGAITWFWMNYSMGLISFWLEETWILRVMLGLIAQFLSGGFVPLNFFPEVWQNLLWWTPFPWLTFAPVNWWIQGGDLSQVLHATLACGFWQIIFIGLSALLWRKGLRLYTAAGM